MNAVFRSTRGVLARATAGVSSGHLRLAGSRMYSADSLSDGMHKIAPLPYDVNNGISEFLSPQALDTAWTQYQGQTLDHLNKVTVGTEYEGVSAFRTLVRTARNPQTAHIFNYASMAHNNEHFFKMIENDPAPINGVLEEELIHSFGSMETLRREMIGTALSMFGPGFVWLVCYNNRDYSVVPTYLAGTPYAEAHWRRQGTDMNTTGAREWAASRSEAEERVAGPQRMGLAQMAPGGQMSVPVLCLNTWEHVWLTDYGIGGKMAYCVNWWTKINWQAVDELRSTVRVAARNQDPATFVSRMRAGEAA